MSIRVKCLALLAAVSHCALGTEVLDDGEQDALVYSDHAAALLQSTRTFIQTRDAVIDTGSAASSNNLAADNSTVMSREQLSEAIETMRQEMLESEEASMQVMEAAAAQASAQAAFANGTLDVLNTLASEVYAQALPNASVTADANASKANASAAPVSNVTAGDNVSAANASATGELPCTRHSSSENDELGMTATLDEAGFRKVASDHSNGGNHSNSGSPINMKRFVCRTSDKIDCRIVDLAALMSFLFNYTGEQSTGQTYPKLEHELQNICDKGGGWIVPSV